MPKQTIKALEEQLKTSRELRDLDRVGHVVTMKELDFYKQRVKDIAAENESLRMDKKWLQQAHSNLLQSMRFSGPKVL